MLQFDIDVEDFRSMFRGSPLMSPPKALTVLHHMRIDLLGKVMTISLTDLVSYYSSATTKATFPENGSFLLPIAALRRLPTAGRITVSFDGTKVGVTDHVITSWTYNTLNVEDFPHIPTPMPDTTSPMDVDSVRWAVTEASRICDPQCITNSLRQISVTPNCVEATDGELFQRYFTPTSSIPFTIPARSLKSFLAALDVDSLEVGNDDSLTSLVSSKRVISFSKYDVPFPSLDSRFNLSVVSNLSEIVVAPKDLIDVIRGIIVDTESLVMITGNNLNVETITLTCSDLTTGYSGTSSFHCTTTAGDFTLTVHSGRLIRMLNAVSTEPKVSLMVGDSSVSYKTSGAQAMLLRRA